LEKIEGGKKINKFPSFKKKGYKYNDGL
jgi:hypothetical protein